MNIPKFEKFMTIANCNHEQFYIKKLESRQIEKPNTPLECQAILDYLAKNEQESKDKELKEKKQLKSDYEIEKEKHKQLKKQQKELLDMIHNIKE